jgi:hypothetical protein
MLLKRGQHRVQGVNEPAKNLIVNLNIDCVLKQQFATVVNYPDIAERIVQYCLVLIA